MIGTACLVRSFGEFSGEVYRVSQIGVTASCQGKCRRLPSRPGKGLRNYDRQLSVQLHQTVCLWQLVAVATSRQSAMSSKTSWLLFCTTLHSVVTLLASTL